MRRSWTYRLLGLLLIPLFSTGAWVAPILQVCPTHGGPGRSHASTHLSEAIASAAHDSHLHGGVSSESSVAAPGEQSVGIATDQDTAKHGCDCVGCCCGANGPAIPGTKMAVAPTAVTGLVPQEIWSIGTLPTLVPHVLPWATAPPVTNI